MEMNIDGLNILTDSEKDVLRMLMSAGASTKEIAVSLGMTSERVKVHMRSILHKLKAKNSVAAA